MRYSLHWPKNCQSISVPQGVTLKPRVYYVKVKWITLPPHSFMCKKNIKWHGTSSHLFIYLWRASLGQCFASSSAGSEPLLPSATASMAESGGNWTGGMRSNERGSFPTWDQTCVFWKFLPQLPVCMSAWAYVRYHGRWSWAKWPPTVENLQCAQFKVLIAQVFCLLPVCVAQPARH